MLDGATVLQNLVPASAERLHFGLCSRSLKNPALQLLQEFPIGLNDQTEAGFQHFRNVLYSRSLKNPTLQLLQQSSKSASTTPQRPIWNTFGTVAVRDFWENG